MILTLEEKFAAYCKQYKITPDKLNQNGIWLVYGDDQSGGLHNSIVPLLGVVSGTLREAIQRALKVDEDETLCLCFSYWSKDRWGRIDLAKELPQ